MTDRQLRSTTCGLRSTLAIHIGHRLTSIGNLSTPRMPCYRYGRLLLSQTTCLSIDCTQLRLCHLQMSRLAEWLLWLHNNVVTGHDLPESDKIAELLARHAEKRWAIYVQRVVDRFKAWWSAIQPNAYWPDRVRLESEGKQGLLVKPENTEGVSYRLLMDNLPPLDVLQSARRVASPSCRTSSSRPAGRRAHRRGASGTPCLRRLLTRGQRRRTQPERGKAEPCST